MTRPNPAETAHELTGALVSMAVICGGCQRRVGDVIRTDHGPLWLAREGGGVVGAAWLGDGGALTGIRCKCSGGQSYRSSDVLAAYNAGSEKTRVLPL